MFTKIKPIFELEEIHGVNLGVGYKINHACVYSIPYQ